MKRVTLQFATAEAAAAFVIWFGEGYGQDLFFESRIVTQANMIGKNDDTPEVSVSFSQAAEPHHIKIDL